MANSKIIYNGNTLIDLTSDTVTANTLLNGYTAHKKDGTKVTGTVITQDYLTGTDEPNLSLGKNGDIYFKVGG